MPKRVLAVFMTLVMLMTACSFRIMYLSGNGGAVRTGGYGSGYTLELTRGRGTVYDCKMRPLTNSDTAYIAVVPPTPAAAADITGQLGGAAAIEALGLLRSSKPAAIEVPQGFLSENCTVVKTFRHYSENQPAAHIIGYTDSENNGVSGIEKAYNDLLRRDTPLTAHFTTDAHGNLLVGASPEIDYSGYDLSSGVVLTIDRELQSAVELAASRYFNAGAAVVMEVATGKIRAMCSLPDFDPENISAVLNDDSSPLINRALLGYNVGSVYKLLVAAAALECGTPPDTEFTCTGSYTVGDKVFTCLGRHGAVNMETALAVSCNIYFIQLARSISYRPILSLSRSAGFGRSILLCGGIEAESGSLPSAGTLGSQPAALANLSFGQGELMLTPLHMAAFVSAVAAGGYYRAPSLIEGVTDGSGNITEATDAAVPARILNSDTADILKNYMINAVETGTGKAARPESGGAGGKTATAETGWVRDGREVYQTWFAGFFPADDPVYAAVVLAEDGASGSRTSAPVFKLIADYVNGGAE